MRVMGASYKALMARFITAPPTTRQTTGSVGVS